MFPGAYFGFDICNPKLFASKNRLRIVPSLPNLYSIQFVKIFISTRVPSGVCESLGTMGKWIPLGWRVCLSVSCVVVVRLGGSRATDPPFAWERRKGEPSDPPRDPPRDPPQRPTLVLIAIWRVLGVLHKSCLFISRLFLIPAPQLGPY